MSVAEREYYFLQDRIESRNLACMEVKKWSVAVASGLVLAGNWVEGIADRIWLLVAWLGISFWVTETMWRAEQWVFIRQIRQLEARTVDVPRVSQSWGRFYFGEENGPNAASRQYDRWDAPDGETSWGRLWHHFWRWRTCLPYLLIVFPSLLIFFGSRWGIAR